MKRSDPFMRASLQAEEVIREHGISTFPVDPIAIARDRDIEVVAKAAQAKGVSGMLLRVGNSYGIAYATDINNAGFGRFSIAHELGHFFLPGHIDAVLHDRDIHESHAGFGSGDRYELEADHFAAALLMPRQMFSAALRRAGDGVAAVKQLAGICKTSLTATAIRLSQCASDPVAIIVSTAGTLIIALCRMLSRSGTASTGFESDTPCHALASPSLSTAIPRKYGVPNGSKVGRISRLGLEDREVSNYARTSSGLAATGRRSPCFMESSSPITRTKMKMKHSPRPGPPAFGVKAKTLISASGHRRASAPNSLQGVKLARTISRTARRKPAREREVSIRLGCGARRV